MLPFDTRNIIHTWEDPILLHAVQEEDRVAFYHEKTEKEQVLVRLIQKTIGWVPLSDMPSPLQQQCFYPKLKPKLIGDSTVLFCLFIKKQSGDLVGYFDNKKFCVQYFPENGIPVVIERLHKVTLPDYVDIIRYGYHNSCSIENNLVEIDVTNRSLKIDDTQSKQGPYGNEVIRFNDPLKDPVRFNSGGMEPFSFSNLKIEKISNFYPSEPRWRKIAPGLNLKGTCKNLKCDAYQNTVYIHKGIGAFAMDKESLHSYCPECTSLITTIQGGIFYDCIFSFEGKRDIEEELLIREKIQAPGGNTFILFEDIKTDWQYLNITTISSENQESESRMHVNWTVPVLLALSCGYCIFKPVVAALSLIVDYKDVLSLIVKSCDEIE